MSRTPPLLRRFSLVLAGALAGSLLLVPGGSQAAESSGTRAQAQTAAARPVLSSDFGRARSYIAEGTFGTAGVVTGTFTPRRFVTNDAGELKAVGVLKATLTRGNGNVVGTTTEKVRILVASIAGTELTPAGRVAARAVGDCDILNLVLGPLDLDLLGLQVHLDRVVLDIIAASGAGNLLGNLLCAVAGLLDNAGVLTEIQRILNSILAILRL